MNTFVVVFLVAISMVAAYEHYEHGPSDYNFAYGVHDPHTGDNHEQYEMSDGHVVKGAYTLKEADGTRRIVEYVAGPHSGFNAVVKRLGHAHHPVHYKHYEPMPHKSYYNDYYSYN